jgi:hypothetical protein
MFSEISLLHVEDIKKIKKLNYYFRKLHLRWFILCNVSLSNVSCLLPAY